LTTGKTLEQLIVKRKNSNLITHHAQISSRSPPADFHPHPHFFKSMYFISRLLDIF